MTLDFREKTAFRAVLVTVALLGAVALAAGAVRVMPLFMDRDLPAGVAMPFARSVAWLALELAVAVGWPVGWAIATAGLVERGEARVFELLGASPVAALRVLGRQAAVFGAALFALSWLAARDAREPGRVVQALLEASREDCARVRAGDPARTVAVPFLHATWLCAEDVSPRLVMRAPGAGPLGLVLTATSGVVSGDVRALSFSDVHVKAGGASLPLQVAVSELTIRHVPSAVASAQLRPLARASALLFGTLVGAFGASWLVYRLRITSRLAAMAVAAAASASAFLIVRSADLAAKEALLALTPVVEASVLGATLAIVLSLRRKKQTATT